MTFPQHNSLTKIQSMIFSMFVRVKEAKLLHCVREVFICIFSPHLFNEVCKKLMEESIESKTSSMFIVMIITMQSHSE